MKTVIQDIRSKLESDSYQNEEHVRLSLVSRILLELGWDIWNPQEVNTEYTVVPQEDYTRVDMALFLNKYTPPSVYIEIKSVGKVDFELNKIEKQLRDYNRNNTSMFTVLTDGRKWRFYYSQTGGEFSHKCFKIIDLLKDESEDIEASFFTFLSKAEIASENAKKEAESYLQLSQKQRALEDALPKARRLTLESPYPSLPDALIKIVSSAGFHVEENEAIQFIQDNSTSKPEYQKQDSKTNRLTGSSAGQSASGSKVNDFPPPENTQCRFKYKGNEYFGYIENDKLKVDGYGSFTSFSSASNEITQTSRNGWLDWELKIPGKSNWILADQWRKK